MTIIRKKKKFSKYHVRMDKLGEEKRTYNNILFDSILEMSFYRDVICPKINSGEIIKAEMQVPFELQPKYKYKDKTIQAVKYIADFLVKFSDGKVKVYEIKGLPDNVSKLKRRIFQYKFPDIDYDWLTFSKIDGGWILYDDAVKFRNKRKKGEK
jgi:hypothetical protein